MILRSIRQIKQSPDSLAANAYGEVSTVAGFGLSVGAPHPGYGKVLSNNLFAAIKVRRWPK